VTQWPSSKAARVYSALLRIGWQLKRQSGSHRTLMRSGWPDFVFAFHDADEIGPRMLARCAPHRPEARGVVATKGNRSDCRSKPSAQ
jgi:predicted RNA binding protein YcfA (HicA-like mRNA interferase family)